MDLGKPWKLSTTLFMEAVPMTRIHARCLRWQRGFVPENYADSFPHKSRFFDLNATMGICHRIANVIIAHDIQPLFVVAPPFPRDTMAPESIPPEGVARAISALPTALFIGDVSGPLNAEAATLSEELDPKFSAIQADIAATLELCHAGNEPVVGRLKEDVESLRSGSESTFWYIQAEVFFNL